MQKKAAFGVLTLLLIAAAMVLTGLFQTEFPSSGTLFERSEFAISENIPFREELQTLMTKIRYRSGVRYFDGIYVANDGNLLLEAEKPASRVLATAKSCVSAFAERKPTYFMLIPTAVVIRQDSIASYAADGLYNQRQFINAFYSDIYKKVGTVDVYQDLYNRRQDYIFYHTEDLPTSLGGYYLYAELAGRLGLRARELSSFSVAYTDYDFYGSLAVNALAPYATPDFLTLYEEVSKQRNYTVTHKNGDTKTTMEGLYLPDGEALADKTDRFLGGLSPVTEITAEGEEENALLVFCDATAKSWLPFLAGHYGRITAIDLDKVTDEELSAIVLDEYSQVLFSYGFRAFSEGVDFSRLEKIP